MGIVSVWGGEEVLEVAGDDGYTTIVDELDAAELSA